MLGAKQERVVLTIEFENRRDFNYGPRSKCRSTGWFCEE